MEKKPFAGDAVEGGSLDPRRLVGARMSPPVVRDDKQNIRWLRNALIAVERMGSRAWQADQEQKERENNPIAAATGLHGYLPFH